MSKGKSTEVVLAGKQPEEEWGDIIRTVLPARFGMHPAIFMDKAQQQAEQLPQPPVTSAAKALFALAAAGELHLQPNLVVRIPGAEPSDS